MSPKFTKPPKKAVDDFVFETEKTSEAESIDGGDWGNLNERVIKLFSLRLNEIQHEKLKIAARKKGLSAQKYVMGILEPMIEKDMMG